ncbi:SMC family ATPase [Oculatella sp. LEGE 06141]|uniref:AAA family ATPase n=1 Tax=Oculatella sp. LEGE 06141 TaxID=1828648 RepID=UPI00187E5A5E|nr:SMC family ATPase [Oculatella sp. LEGE 06141]MBE9177928.1 SMC family ATPase [Oculatella sp. LEGE 06141]
MEILSVTLKNFKSHSDRHFQFQPGTNAICGENGAGKTSILEAIAWTLFNYRGAYKIEDLIRNGAGSAQATIAFISSRDGRTYEIQRCTTKGYTVYDPQLGSKLDYKHIEDEIMPWLRQQMGVPIGTDLGKLFANTIGVPQGTFTADFLQPPENRKKIFDTVLKVEEYRQTTQQMLSLEKYGKVEVDKLECTIAQYDERLQDWEPLQQRRQQLRQDIATAESSLQQLRAELATLQTEKERLAGQTQHVQRLEAQRQQLEAQIAGQQQATVLLQQSVTRSQQAVQTCTVNREHYQAVLQAEATLEQLEQQMRQRQALLQQRETHQIRLAERQTELTKLSLQLESIANAQAEIERFQPTVMQQGELEQQQASLAEQLQQIQALKLEQKTLLKQQSTVQAHLAQLDREIQRVQALAASVDQMAELEQKRDRLQEQLSRVEAARQFEAELRQLVTEGEEKRDRHQDKAESAIDILRDMQKEVPLLAADSVSSALFAIQAGVDLNTELLNALWQILADLSEQISAPKLKQQLHQLKLQLETTYQHRAEFATLDAKTAHYTQLKDDLEPLQTRLSHLQSQLAAEPALQQQWMQVAETLKQLGNPRGRCQLLAQELQQHSRLQAAHTQLQQAQTAIQQDIADCDRQLEPFAALESQIAEQQRVRQTHQPGYLVYLQHQNDANQLATVEAELQAAIAQLQTVEAKRAEVQAQYEALLQTYDPDQWQQVETAYNQTRSRADQLAGGLPQQQTLLTELDNRSTVLQDIADKRDRAQLELKQKEKVRRFITFARKVYKEAGPRVTERYVQSISREADRIFRELLNRPNVALEWSKDYEILVQDGAHPRRFINLSGGEQMCAALAVRLALLRVLADIDIAFFDEPTTNMDKPRRASLAEAIANIKTFRQLFVISHDDTFEQVTENVILVERDAS